MVYCQSRSSSGQYTPNCLAGRRRKVRCIYNPESPNICKRCLKYNIECVDPSQQASDIGAEDRKTLRERVSRLEERLDAIQDGTTSRSDAPSSSHIAGGHEESEPLSASRDSQDEGLPGMDVGRHMAPLIAVLQGSNVGNLSSGLTALPGAHYQLVHLLTMLALIGPQWIILAAVAPSIPAWWN